MINVNHEYYVSLEVAKLLKEARFDWRVRYMYRNNNPTLCICTETSYRNIPKPNKCPMYWQYAAPAIEVAQRWLREVKDIDIMVHIDYHYGEHYSKAYYCTFYIGDELYTIEHLKTYEGALEAGIQKALEIILKERE